MIILVVIVLIFKACMPSRRGLLNFMKDENLYLKCSLSHAINAFGFKIHIYTWNFI
jgi:hypothetical protein